MNDNAPLPSSFRDPSGFLFRRDGTLYRQVNRTFAEPYERLMSSGLYGSLTGKGLLIPHEEVSVPAAGPDAHKILRPEPVAFISYPYEWSFAMLKDAALTTLRIQKLAMEAGMSLRDATAYNIQFHHGKPILIDTLSFEPIPEGKPWVAYRQFCQHFLAPLALMKYRDIRLGELVRVHIDGIPLDLTASLLPRRTRLRPGLAMHIHLQAKVGKRQIAKGTGGARPARKRTFSLQAFKGLVDNLEASVRRLEWSPEKSTWGGYYEECDHYTQDAFDHKKSLVGKFLEELRPSSVWDLGANTGLFSRLAAERDIPVVSFEYDPACVDANYRQAVTDGETKVLPLVCDLTNPAPALGWANEERSSFVERGPVDCAMALALIHHLAIANNVPLPRVASFLGSIARALIIEFVPKGDPKVDVLLSTREDIFPGYTREGFEAAFGEVFTIERAEPISGSERTLYLMRAR